MQSTPSKRYQQLQPEDRVTLASLVQQKHSVRAMAQVLGRSPSTISRDCDATHNPQATPAPRHAPAPNGGACRAAHRASSIVMASCSG